MARVIGSKRISITCHWLNFSSFSTFSPWKWSSTVEAVTVQAKRRERARWTFEVILPHRNLHKSQQITYQNAANYRKIPKISPGAYIFQRPFLRGLLLSKAKTVSLLPTIRLAQSILKRKFPPNISPSKNIFGGAYIRREIFVSKSIGLAL